MHVKRVVDPVTCRGPDVGRWPEPASLGRIIETAERVQGDWFATGRTLKSHVMADKPVTIRRSRVGRKIGHLDDSDIARLNVALAFVMGLAD